MWTLWIISSIIDSAEPKYTEYKQFDNVNSCYIELAVLETTFTQGEYAVCDDGS